MAVDKLEGVDSAIKRDLAKLNERLDHRARLHRTLQSYETGNSPLPAAIQRAGITRAYRMLMPASEAPWGSLITGSTLDRLEVNGLIDTEDPAAAEACLKLWQENSMDLESKVAHSSVLTDGRAGAIVWREPESDIPTVSLDGMQTLVVKYREGRRQARDAESALRRWMGEDDKPYCTLYTADALYKFVGPKNSSGFQGTQWERRRVPDEDWPLDNPYNVLPAVELGINRKLKPGCFPYARGEYEHCTGLIDRIHLLTFFGLVVAFWMGFPLRGVIGEKILRDDNNEIIPPFDAHASGLFQLENKDARIEEYTAADRNNLMIFPELDQLSSITKTPRHYFPMEAGMQNLAADAIRASEGALHAKCSDYKPSLGEGWEQVCRLMGLMSDDEVELSRLAKMQWKDHESRSLAERADAAGKLAGVLPPVAIATRILNFSMEEWRAWAAEESANPIAQIAAQLVEPAPVAPVAPETNGATPNAVPTG